MPRLDFYAEFQPFLSLRIEGPGILVGRGPDCDVQLPGSGVSRCHARIRSVDGGHEIEDLSRNGTRVNAAWVRGRQRLSAGDRVYVGDRVFLYQPDTAAVATLQREVTVVEASAVRPVTAGPRPRLRT